ncbi:MULTISPECIES: HU family DNA-binding protein [Sphingobacterium]|jgi:nucleoid DNA-binding protein|uniref:HU family DNA-binding protein n=1 Tax=Sphingobacterium TaxID=28453 RepID=UPI0004E5EF96|nr:MULTISPECIES: HU family DNA-binding protein [Sphingobacterium]CDT25778.1 conserved hypothetical protein [Sphingobacterium sp. PM2-P1-29]SJN52207.1 hypothetical protein FM120_34555 [Sphingobacterium faecium PCAi_F2.5]UPZ36320.1 hypothetical protein MUB18_19710 [Sphingobacterium sp. PCS056]UXD67924.1 hypothetical protein MUK51_11875 [Sphingobacterium faecium]WGQ15634.1 hypothetical protein QG727_04315 [Sphingobacterium faecium]
MNKKETLEKVSELSQVTIADCKKVLDALEVVMQEELANRKGIRNIFDMLYKLMGVFKSK